MKQFPNSLPHSHKRLLCPFSSNRAALEESLSQVKTADGLHAGVVRGCVKPQHISGCGVDKSRGSNTDLLLREMKCCVVLLLPSPAKQKHGTNFLCTHSLPGRAPAYDSGSTMSPGPRYKGH